MKRIAIVLCVFLLSSMLYAQTAITIGGNYWRAKPDLKTQDLQDLTVSDGNMMGPYINLRSGKLVIGGSLFIGNFKMEEEVDSDYYGYYSNYGFYDYDDSYKYEITLKRTDVNVSLGYSISRYVTIFGALKNLKGQFTDFKVNGEAIDLNEDLEYKGTMLGGGLSGVLPLGQQSPLFLFGSFAYLTGEIEWPSGDKLKNNLASITVGAGYRLSRELNLLVGFRSDAMSEGEDEDAYEKYQGITASIGYTFQ